MISRSDEVWKTSAEEFMSIEHLSQKRSLHPEIIRLASQFGGGRLLDYGCGDGRILEMFPAEWKIDAYDPSSRMLELAQMKIGDRVENLYADVGSMKKNYDMILLGMVLLCISTEAEVGEVLRNCADRMHPGAHLVITTTHPCFRNFRFSNFAADFATGRTFRYMEDGLPFEVTLGDVDGNSITFTDYHWSLEFTFRKLSEAGLAVYSLSEVRDDPESSDKNDLIPAFLIFDCMRTK